MYSITNEVNVRISICTSAPILAQFGGIAVPCETIGPTLFYPSTQSLVQHQ